MKINKRSAIFIVFILGVLIFATSAFADIMLGSGYHSLKNSAKTTAEKLTNEVDNFSIDVIVSLKVDGEIFLESTDNTKFDFVKQSRITNGTHFEKGEMRKNYSYSDENQSIYKNFEDGSYNVTEKQKSNNNRKLIENPFEEERVKDAEKIMDAFVGSLEDIIQIEESGGKKMYMGNISDTEVPPLVNAVSSFALKYSIINDYTAKRLDVPYPKSNIYVINASGKAIESEEGLIESGIFTASMSAEDSNGTEHVYTVEFSIDVKDINNTVVVAPDLNGQKVTYVKEGFEFDTKYIGKYKNDIVKEENNSFVKQGERIVEITSADKGSIKGRYYEVYNEGYAPDTVRNFEFSSNYGESRHYTILNYTDSNGEKKKGVIRREGLQNISISFDVTFDEDDDGNVSGYSYSNYDGDFDTYFFRILE
ncbi:hypothetical protein HZF24_14355 [Sedimentibacter hydroxybenzoicus DSM 7310]|uniref:Uncharacterized protein n=1 Tax=Sedimentibacter hydroxybenzoicus DSM 7310 TaxID=1123245 RepID=A0A974BM16_SEDHY|nr:hypothetical protein [Sedimentibacter hydroxybenzoicus]NYB75326.1 hypothetical protein [Sedimentibacter hydroxybenzoicus DSM 7310]